MALRCVTLLVHSLVEDRVALGVHDLLLNSSFLIQVDEGCRAEDGFQLALNVVVGHEHASPFKQHDMIAVQDESRRGDLAVVLLEDVEHRYMDDKGDAKLEVETQFLFVSALDELNVLDLVDFADLCHQAVDGIVQMWFE